MNHHILAYAINAFWQVPLLAAAAWLTVRLLRPSLRLQHTLWVAALILSALLPLRGEFSPAPARLPAAHRLGILPPASFASTTGDAPLTPKNLASAAHPPNATAPLTLPFRTVSLPAPWQPWLVGLFLLTTGWFALRLLLSLLAIRRILADSIPLTLTPGRQALLHQAAERIGVPPPSLTLTHPSAGPLVAGLLQPRIVLPTAMLHSTDQQFTAALLHELAHLRRHDLEANLALKLLALPIAWHPAAALLDRRIHKTREMLCDQLAAHASSSPHAYARNLLSLSRSLLPGSRGDSSFAVGLFTQHPPSLLEERIMNLIAPAPRPSFRPLRCVAATAIMTTALAAVTLLHVTPSVLAAQNASAIQPASSAATDHPQTASPAATKPKVRSTERRNVDRPGSASVDAQSSARPQKAIEFDDRKLNALAAQMDRTAARFELEVNRQATQLNQNINSTQIQRQVQQAEEAAFKVQRDSAVMQTAIDAKLKVLNDPAFQQRLAEARRKLAEARLDSPQFQARIAEAERRQTQAAQQLAQASASLAKARAQVNDPAIQKELEAAQQALDQARDQARANPIH